MKMTRECLESVGLNIAQPTLCLLFHQQWHEHCRAEEAAYCWQCLCVCVVVVVVVAVYYWLVFVLDLGVGECVCLLWCPD